MFSLEISFQDGSTDSETVYIQRPHAIIGSSDYAHVVIGDLENLPYELHVFRGIGRKFRTAPIAIGQDRGGDLPAILEGEFDTEAKFDLGTVVLEIAALDTDLTIPQNEPLDKGAVRILRRAASVSRPEFPALAVGGEFPMAVSFSPDEPIFIGRDRDCVFRLDAPDVSGKHARITYEDGEFLIEDLGSTNGTFISGQQLSGKARIPSGQPIIIGRSVVMFGVDTGDKLELEVQTTQEELSALPEEKYPMLISLSEVARPPRMVLREGSTVRVGREPSSDLWLGAPHVSRKHCTIEYQQAGNIVLTDLSMNGLAYDGGVLTQGESVQLGERPAVLNFGGGVTVAVCLSDFDEKTFSDSSGSPVSFVSESSETRARDLLNGDGGNFATNETGSGFLKRKSRSPFLRFFKGLRLYQRIVLLVTIFFVILAVSLTLKLIFPLIFSDL